MNAKPLDSFAAVRLERSFAIMDRKPWPGRPPERGLESRAERGISGWRDALEIAITIAENRRLPSPRMEYFRSTTRWQVSETLVAGSGNSYFLSHFERHLHL